MIKDRSFILILFKVNIEDCQILLLSKSWKVKMKKIIFLPFLIAACSTNMANKTNSEANIVPKNTSIEAVIKYDYKSKEITQVCDEQMKATDQRVSEVLKIPKAEKNFHNTIEAFETILADLSDKATPATFMYYVSLNKDLRKEGEQCESALGQYLVGLTSRRDVYDAFVRADKNSDHKKLSVAENRLIEETAKGFRKNGLFLPDDELKKVKELRQKLANLETEFS
jgi:Zn-dependent oligopeptidase